jgi:hypothetical protein
VEHGFAGLDESGKVEDAVKGFSLGLGGCKNLLKSRPVSKFSLNKINAGGQEVASAMAQIVKNNRVGPILSQ